MALLKQRHTSKRRAVASNKMLPLIKGSDEITSLGDEFLLYSHIVSPATSADIGPIATKLPHSALITA